MFRTLARAAVAALSACLLLAATPKVVPPAVGLQAPDFRLPDQNGKPVVLAADRGQKVVLVFYRGYW